MESALMTSKRESRKVERNSDLPTAVGPKRTIAPGAVSGLRVSIPDLLREDLLDRSGNDLPPVGFQVFITGQVDLDAALHCRAGHFIDVSLKAFQEVER
jgi:hypothetical protein